MNRPLLQLAASSIIGLTIAALAQQPVIPGAPLAGLTSRELELFRLGREDFLEVESPDEGLGADVQRKFVCAVP